MSFVAYYRVSTDKQGRSGLGLEAQKEAVAHYLPNGVQPIAEYCETESGKRNDRPELQRALDHCRRSGARLCVAKIDRLARSANFLLNVLSSGVEVEFADLPQVSGPQGKFLLTSMAAVAELEAGLISERTKAALQAAKKRGVKLGNPQGGVVLSKHREKAIAASTQSRAEQAKARAEAWRGEITAMVSDGLSNAAIAKKFNDRGEPSVSGRGAWTSTAVRRIRERLAA